MLNGMVCFISINRLFLYWGNPVQNQPGWCGCFVRQTNSAATYVHKQPLLHSFMNTFSTRSYTANFVFYICLVRVLHTSHTTYNNHFFLKEIKS